MIGLWRHAFLGVFLTSLVAVGEDGGLNPAPEAVTNESPGHFYDWREDGQYGHKINRIVRELDLSEFRSIIVRCDSPELPDGNYIVRCDSLEELPSCKMYYSLKMQDGKMYGFPRVIPAPGTPSEDVSNNILIKSFRKIGESVWLDGINNTYLVSDILIDIENKTESPAILLGHSLAGDELSILPLLECNHELYTIIHARNIYIPPRSVYQLHGKIIPHPSKLITAKPSRKTQVMKLPEKMKEVYIELTFQTVIIGKKLRVYTQSPQKFIYRCNLPNAIDLKK